MFNQRQQHGWHNKNDDPSVWGGRRRRQQVRFWNNRKEQLWAAVAGAASLMIWYATPVSRWATSLLLRYYVPVEEDILLGRQALRDGLFTSRYPTVRHSQYTPLLESIGRDLVRTYRHDQRQQRDHGKSTRPSSSTDNRHGVPPSGSSYNEDPYEWDFGVVRADFVNAFALPGGTIRVTTGLLNSLQPTRGELAALLGHEMGHVVHRHSQARILQEQLLTTVLQAILDNYSPDNGSDGYGPYNPRRRQRDRDETFGQAVGKLLVRSARWLGDQRFSRRDEYEADAVAWDLLASTASHYNPQSVISLLRKLEQREQHHSLGASFGATGSLDGGGQGVASAIAEWTRTHPATSDRLRALERKWKDLPAYERRRFQARLSA
jgi:predicted Zn-dependent protease